MPRSRIFIALLFAMTHAISAYWGAHKINSGIVAGLNLESTIHEWALATVPSDAGFYAAVANNVADDKGLVIESDLKSPQPAYTPFAYWTPGTPWVIGSVLDLFNSHSMKVVFAFAVFAQVVSGILILLTLALWTQNPWALGLTALFTGFNWPLQNFFYSAFLCSSEVVILIPMAAFFYFLARGFKNLSVLDFGIAGVFLGLTSLIRDSNAMFAPFLVVMIPLLLTLKDKRFLKKSIFGAIALFACCQIVLTPLKIWNKKRVGFAVLSTSGSTMWRHGIWEKYGVYAWHASSGIGFGDYLDHEARERVELAFQKGEGSPLYSATELFKAIAKHPGDAVLFKVQRLPVLWLGTNPWPQSQLTWVSGWCLLFYLCLLTYFFLCWKRKASPPEVLYLYALFLTCASIFIHFEFRYTFPVWITLVCAPGLLIVELQKKLTEK